MFATCNPPDWERLVFLCLVTLDLETHLWNGVILGCGVNVGMNCLECLEDGSLASLIDHQKIYIVSLPVVMSESNLKLEQRSSRGGSAWCYLSEVTKVASCKPTLELGPKT